MGDEKEESEKVDNVITNFHVSHLSLQKSRSS